MKKDILCTLGPASLNEKCIQRLASLGVTLFRINLSHTDSSQLEGVIQMIQKSSSVPICLDTEGAQIRTGVFPGGEKALHENHLLEVSASSKKHDHHLQLYPQGTMDLLCVGDILRIDAEVLCQVIQRKKEGLRLRVIHGGCVGSNRAVTVERAIALPVLTQKDESAIQQGLKMGIRHVALSFANQASDVDELRELVGSSTSIISKIECRNGLRHVEEIAKKSDCLLVDRGDLSREEPLERIPRIQKAIIRQAKAMKKKVYVATNLLESMVTSLHPNRAEVNDVMNTLNDGADGLVLAAETAIGKNPVQCVQMIIKLVKEFEAGGDSLVGSTYLGDAQSLLIEPHGGSLVSRLANNDEAEGLVSVPVDEKDLMDCEQIAIGTFSPLMGFMDKDTLDSVLENNKLLDGTSWTMPLILQIPGRYHSRIKKNESLVLVDQEGTAHSILDCSSVYRYDVRLLTKKWFGTDSPDHPGVARVLKGGNLLAAGEIKWIESENRFQPYHLRPSQSRLSFTHKGWSKVVGFHTRNVIHRAHEHIQMKALEITGADGLFVSPVIGSQKKGDFLPWPVIQSYQLMMERGFYPEGKVVLGCFSTYPRFCGPREAVFTALCRKNMGCSHIIIGRNHAGVGTFYQDSEYKRLFDSLELGIEPVFFDEVGFNPERKDYEFVKPRQNYNTISGTQMRRALRADEALPSWFMRQDIQDMLRGAIKEKREVFCE